ncbi:MAG: autotransporter-associated beta strand repeat-containing protein [Opitutaceae bacterium]|jgi:autotransporter-associated beta strand protein|nr:autotransporter-associated beta strand repeat-containing protein [Opitutaceae bacterium]
MKTSSRLLSAALLPLVLPATSLFAQTSTWIGTGIAIDPGFWSDTGNWSGTAPTDGATVALVFNNTVNSWGNNNLTNLTVSSFTVPANNGATTPVGIRDNVVTGNAITLTGGFTVSTGAWQTFGFDIALGAGSGSFTQTTGQTTFGGVISGSQNITKAGGGTLIFSGANTFSGNLNVNTGAVRLGNNAALGTTAGKTTVASGARVELTNNITVTGETIEIQGNGGDNTNGGVIRNLSGANTWAGNVVTIGNDSRLIAAAGTLTVSGVISSNNPANNQVIFRSQGGTIELTNQNTYLGTTRVFGTPTDPSTVMVRLSGGDNRLPVGTSLDIGGGGVSGHVQLSGVSQELAGLVSNAGATASRISGVGTATLVINNAAAGTFTGSLTDSLAFVKKGAGAYTLTNVNNNYTRGTVIEAGLLATGLTSGNFGTGDVTVGAGAFLELGNAFSIADAANLFITPTSSVMLTFGGTENIGMLGNSQTSSYVPVGTYDATSLNAFFGGSIFSGSGLLNVTMTSAIPEPSAAALLAGFAVLGAVALRRRPRAA